MHLETTGNTQWLKIPALATKVCEFCSQLEMCLLILSAQLLGFFVCLFLSFLHVQLVEFSNM